MGDLRMDPDVIQTKRIVCDYILYKIESSEYRWPTCPPLPDTPNEICVALRALGQEFQEKYRGNFTEMCSQLQFTTETANETFHGVLNEVFSYGITWARVIGVFSFTGALAVQCIVREMPELVDLLAEWLTIFIENQLKPWLDNHGGWGGLLEFQKSSSLDNKDDPAWKRMKNYFFGITAGALGALTLGVVFART